MNLLKHLILVKHSAPEIEEAIPAREWLLSAEGRLRARRLAESLKPFQPEVVVSSVEPKARETARILAENLGLGFQALVDLHEHDRSQSPHYTAEEFQRLVRELFAKPAELIFGSETALAALHRFRAALEPLMDAHPDKNVLVVAHGTVIALYVAWLTGYDGYKLWKELGLPSFVVLDLRSKTLLETINLT